MEQLNEDNERERSDLMSTIDVEKRVAEQQVICQYMSHFLVGIKVYKLK